MSASERRKGNRVECEIVNAHKELGIHAERYPLSGASHFRGQAHDIDLYPFGREEAPLVAEVKARGEGKGFALLERWLSDYDALFLKRDRQEPLVVLPWRVWARLIGGKHEVDTVSDHHRARGGGDRRVAGADGKGAAGGSTVPGGVSARR